MAVTGVPFLLLILFVGVFSETVHFKGNLLFKEYGTNYLNQDPLFLSRRLETSDLKLFARTFKASSDLYMSFCDSIKRLFFQLNPELETPPQYTKSANYTFIVSTDKHILSEAPAVCRNLAANLPEIRSRADDIEVIKAVDKYKIETIIANVQYDQQGNYFAWNSDLSPVATNSIYPTPYYGGRHTNSWYQAKSWTDSHLLQDASSYYLTFVRARDGLAFRLSDSITPSKKDFIICQKDTPRPPANMTIEANILIQVTMGTCTRDVYSVVESTRNAIEQIHLITTIKLDLENKNDTILKDFLPKFDNSKRMKRTSLTQNESTTPPSFQMKMSCRSIATAESMWDPLYIENYFKYPVILIPKVSNSVSSFVETCYQYWYFLRTRELTSHTFHGYLDVELEKVNLTYCSKAIEHVHFQSSKLLNGPFPQSIEYFQNNHKTISLYDPKDPFIFHLDNRPQRDIGTIASATVIGSLVGGAAYVIRSFIDLVTMNKYASAQDISRLSHQINDIKINQYELQGALRHVNQRLTYYERAIQDIYTGIAAISLEADIKNFNRYLQNVLGNTLNSYAQAFSSAMDGKTSPFALSSVELSNFASNLHTEKRITLDTNLNKIKTTAVIIGSAIHFFFEIPIIADEFFYSFFSIIKVPAFDKNVTYWPDTEDSNIAISKDGTKYTILSSIELDKCMDVPPICRSSHPISPTSNKDTCVISTYITNKRTCNFRPSNQQSKPFLYFSDSSLFYSVPFNTTLFIACPGKQTSLSKEPAVSQQSVTISGMGDAIYRPSCTISLEDGTSYKTPAKQEIINLDDWPLFRLKSHLPHPFENVISIPSTFAPIQIKESEKQSTENFQSDWLDIQDTKTILYNVGIILIPFIGLTILGLCFWRRVKKWIDARIGNFNNQTGNATESNEEFQFVSIPLTPSKQTAPSTPKDPENPIPTPIFRQSTDNINLPIPQPPPILKRTSSQKNVQFQFLP